MEPIFSTARQQPLGIKNGTQEKENNRETGGVFQLRAHVLLEQLFVPHPQSLVMMHGSWIQEP